MQSCSYATAVATTAAAGCLSGLCATALAQSKIGVKTERIRADSGHIIFFLNHIF